MPSVAVCDQHWNNSAQCPQDMITLFPWYLAENYYGLWRRYHQQLHDFFQGLPEELAARIITVQVSQGSTGDLCPWHGNPVDPEYIISDERWQDVWVNGTATMVEIWRDLAPTTKLLFNAVPPVNTTADQKAWPAYRHVIMDVLQPPNFDVKYGVESHQYFTNYELDDYHGAALTRTPFRDPRTGEVSFVRSRGEMSDRTATGHDPGKYFFN